MKRILIIGSPGAGKSTFALELGRLLHLPIIHLDKEFWQAGWLETPKVEWRERLGLLVEQDEWIIDGTYDGTLNLRLARADGVFFLDYPRHLCLWRIIKRIVLNHGRVRFDMARDCPEKVDLSFYKWTWNYRRDHYPAIYEALQRHFLNGKLIIFKNPAEAERFLRQLE